MIRLLWAASTNIHYFTRRYLPSNVLLDAILAHPILIERPLVETEKGVRLGRPPEAIREIV